MQSVLRLHLLCQPEQTELMLQRVQPLFCLKWLFSFFEDWWLGILEFFEITKLVGLWSLSLIMARCLMLAKVCMASPNARWPSTSMANRSDGVGGGGGGRSSSPLPLTLPEHRLHDICRSATVSNDGWCQEHYRWIVELCQTKLIRENNFIQ